MALDSSCEDARKQHRAWVLGLVKVFTSLGLLVILFSRLDLFRFYKVLVSANVYYFSIAVGARLAAKMLMAVRWAVLAKILGFRDSLGQFLLYYLFGMFFNLFMPGTVGGDAVRVFYLFRDRPRISTDGKSSMGRAVLSAVADRLIGGVVLLWIGAIALVVFPAQASAVPRIARYSIWIAAVGSVFVWPFVWISGSLLRAWRALASVARLQDCLMLYRSNLALILQTILLSVIIHFLQTWVQILIGRSIDLDVPWSYFLIVFPLVDILSMAPLTVSGLGLREGGYFYFLGQFGIQAEQAVACGTLWFIVVLLNGLVGGVLFSLYRKSTAARSSEETSQLSE